MKKLMMFYVSLGIVIVASTSLALKARNNHVIYTRNLANGMCDVLVPGKAILSNTTFGFLATNVPGPCELVITTKVVN
ncbi:hypothetical protein HF324_14915 [Chitinophaga oryzae]|uniref:Uncharacterized protein n=1 Tax=Chitinophaga oryzae TaxID=2725414 RepID=A0ABX6LJR5_9BACT|nr:hypothetical protein [Chitinophaga oryzae]QJB39083.1 hypothetical protein HF324_14915 [Chitinophaga oryzae]